MFSYDHGIRNTSRMFMKLYLMIFSLGIPSVSTAATLYSGFDVKVPGKVPTIQTGPGAQQQDPCTIGFDSQDSYIAETKTNLDDYYTKKIEGFRKNIDIDFFRTTETETIGNPFSVPNCGPGGTQSCYCNPSDDEFAENSWDQQTCGTPLVVAGQSLVWNGTNAGGQINSYIPGVYVQAMTCFKEKAKTLLDTKKSIPALASYEALAEDTKKITEKAQGTANQAQQFLQTIGQNVTNFCAAKEDAQDCTSILSRAPANLDNAAKSRIAVCQMKSAVQGNVAAFNYVVRGYVLTMASHAFKKLWLNSDSIIRNWLNNAQSLTKQCVDAAIREGRRYGKKKRSRSRGERRARDRINQCLASDVVGKDIKKILDDYVPSDGACTIGMEL